MREYGVIAPLHCASAKILVDELVARQLAEPGSIVAGLTIVFMKDIAPLDDARERSLITKKLLVYACIRSMHQRRCFARMLALVRSCKDAIAAEVRSH